MAAVEMAKSEEELAAAIDECGVFSEPKQTTLNLTVRLVELK